MASAGDSTTYAGCSPTGLLLRTNLAAFGALGVRLSASALAYLLQIILARALGASNYGTFSFAWSLVTIGGFLATLGYAQIAVRFLAQYQQSGDLAEARGFLRQSLLATMGGSLLSVCGLLLLFPLVERGYGSLCCAALSIGLVALPFFALTDLIEGFARSQGWTIRALTPPYLLRGGLLIALLLAAIATGMTLDAPRAMSLALISTVIACCVQVAITMPALLRLFPSAKPTYDTARWTEAARPTFLTDLAVLARQNIDLIFLGLVATPQAVGLYFAASRIASLLGLSDLAVAEGFGHRFARAVAVPDRAVLRRTYREAWLLNLLPGALLAAALYGLAPWILGMFGAEFVAATPLLQILIAAGFLRLAIGPAEDLLMMTGHAGCVWRANLIGAAVMALGCLALTPMLGAKGAAIGTALGTLATVMQLLCAMRGQLGIKPFAGNDDP